jgi:hypothetical protein
VGEVETEETGVGGILAGGTETGGGNFGPMGALSGAEETLAIAINGGVDLVLAGCVLAAAEEVASTSRV